jgi:hypothetical protein
MRNSKIWNNFAGCITKSERVQLVLENQTKGLQIDFRVFAFGKEYTKNEKKTSIILIAANQTETLYNKQQLKLTTERILPTELQAKIEKNAFSPTRLQNEFVLQMENRAFIEYMEKIPLTLDFAL